MPPAVKCQAVVQNDVEAAAVAAAIWTTEKIAKPSQCAPRAEVHL